MADPVVSDDGSIVLLTSTVPATEPDGVDSTLVRVHDRTTASTTDLPDADTYHAVINTLVDGNAPGEALDVVKEMLQQGVEPDVHASTQMDAEGCV